MSGTAMVVSKLAQSVALRQWHSLKNNIVRLSAADAQYTRFHSQFGEDRYIYNNIDLPANGTFVDVGAGHPIHLSNTYFFEKNGWTGVCIDADPKQYDLLTAVIGAIDILDLDVEGTELDVWPTFDYDKHRPRVVVIEHSTFGLADNSEKIKDFFARLPYRLVHITHTNFIYVSVNA
jgi:hypothetical protein